MSIQQNLIESFSYSLDGLIGHWKRWIALIIGTIIFPIIYGYSVRVMAGEEPAPSMGSLTRLFIDGIKLILIMIGYYIIPVLVFMITAVLAVILTFPVDGSLNIDIETADNPFVIFGIFPGLLASILIFIVLAFIAGLYSSMGMVQFARTGRMTSAFEIGDISSRIRQIGWGQYLLAVLAIWIVAFAISGVISLVSIPGFWFSMLSSALSIIITPVLTIFSSRYFSLLYDSGNSSN